MSSYGMDYDVRMGDGLQHAMQASHALLHQSHHMQQQQHLQPLQQHNDVGLGGLHHEVSLGVGNRSVDNTGKGSRWV